MKKKTLSVLLVTLLLGNALPVTSFATETDQEQPESSEQSPELEPETTQPEVIEPEEQPTPEVPVDPIGPEEKPVITPELIEPQAPPINETVDIPIPEVIQPTEENTVTVIDVPAEAIRFERNESTESFVAKIGEEARTVGQDKDRATRFSIND